MGLPDFTPPTDNLYKFLAITGLLVIGWSSASLYYLDSRAKDMAITSASLANEAQAKIKLALEEEKAAKISSASPTTLQSATPTATPTEKTPDELEQRAKEDGIEAAKLVAAYSLAAQQVLNADADYVWAIKKSWIVFGVGILLVAVGFWAWLCQVQLKEDELLRLQVAKAKIELRQLELASQPSTPPVAPRGRASNK